ncbi:MAG: replication initiator protein A [Verrucomicrobiaceae bacterium]|nr:replication initiator protein A [Verrucomicrobiaceae bacterium]
MNTNSVVTPPIEGRWHDDSLVATPPILGRQSLYTVAEAPILRVAATSIARMSHLFGKQKVATPPILSFVAITDMPEGMGRKIEGGIKEHQDLARFAASSADIAPKDQIDLMARCWFSLTHGRTEAIAHEYVDNKTGITEIVRITGSSEHGIATIYDQDLLIFAISQWIDAKRLGLPTSRRIHFTPYQFFGWLGIASQGTAYARLKEALHRLKTTTIETTIRANVGKRTRNRVRQFSWISEWEITEEEGEVRGIEVVLAEWLFESIQDFHVLTLDKRYFEIHGGVERWLYLYARKATGGANGTWKETFKSLYKKSASQQAYKHYANALRKLVEKNGLPGLRLEKTKSTSGDDMLLMERTEKREAIEARAKLSTPKIEAQLALIERTPLEDAWENVLELMRRHLGEATTNSWLAKLQLQGLEDGVLTLKAPTKFIADWVSNNYRFKLIDSWKSVGQEIHEVRLIADGKNKAA